MIEELRYLARGGRDRAKPAEQTRDAAGRQIAEHIRAVSCRALGVCMSFRAAVIGATDVDSGVLRRQGTYHVMFDREKEAEGLRQASPDRLRIGV